MTEFSFDALRRWPDVEADNLFAADAADRLILDEAAAAELLKRTEAEFDLPTVDPVRNGVAALVDRLTVTVPTAGAASVAAS